jgi:hypothetical protein
MDYLWVKHQLSNESLSVSISSITIHNLLDPLRSHHRNSSTRSYHVRTARQGISRPIRAPGLIHNAVLQTQQFGEELLLPRSMEALIGQLHQTLLISIYGKFRKLEVLSPLLYSQNNHHVLFLIGA